MALMEQEITDKFALYNGDCIDVMESFPDDKIHLSIYSPPFGGLYNYSSDERDLSNCSDYDDFFVHYDFVLDQIHRITLPGRITAVHATDIPTGNSGKDSITDFPGDIIISHVRCRKNKCKESERNRLNGRCGHGWFNFIARHVIWKEPLWVRNRTMAKCLSHKTIIDDATYGGVACADYILVFRKKGENKIPISNPSGLSRYAGQEKVPKELLKFKDYNGNQIQNKYSQWIWRRYASSIWDDIDISNVLPFKVKDPDDEKHVHPLQLDVIDRTVILRSNEGENVFTPFMGIGSEVYSAVRHNRKGIGVELKKTYYNQALLNVGDAVNSSFLPEQYKLELSEEAA